MKNILIYKNFYSDYKKLRSEFESHFSDTKLAHSKRFVWDFWYDKDLYRHLRTPAYAYFNNKNYVDFHSRLVQWGRENLGCHDISPPWLSYYVEGCYQKIHSDVPHGPWAYVYSLTPNAKKFTGGDTIVLKSETLSYWSSFAQNEGREFHNYFDTIESKMNQLIIFDPRFPHGVSEVKGTQDPLESRLVMHGWFVNPRPYVVGGLSTRQAQLTLSKSIAQLNKILEDIDLLHGAISIRLEISPSGKVSQYKVLTNTLRSLNLNDEDASYLVKELSKILKQTQFIKANKKSTITLPLIFK